MSFFIRKALKAGPVRFNLSKSGVGVSGGVTGARVGLSPKGVYVHGGRHGLYYRKYQKAGSKRSRKPRAHHPDTSAAPAQKNVSITDSGMVEVFVDTGATYPSPISLPEERPMTVPELPESRPYGYAFLAAFMVLLIPGLITGSIIWHLLFLLSTISLLMLYIRQRQFNKTAVDLLEQFKSRLDPADTEQIRQILSEMPEKLPGLRQRKWFSHHGLLAMWIARVQQPEDFPENLIHSLVQQSGLSEEHQKRIRVACFRIFFDELAADHQLTDEDERFLYDTAKTLQLNESDLSDEFETIRILGEVRAEIQNKPEPVESPIPLQKNETCYMAVPGRLLNERVQDYRTIDTIRHKYIGYDIEIEGQVVLTDKRIIIAGKDTRSYRLSRVLDVTLSLEDASVQLNLDRRKSPVIITVERPQILAARLQHLLED